jgi:hypothetical protein
VKKWRAKESNFKRLLALAKKALTEKQAAVEKREALIVGLRGTLKESLGESERAAAAKDEEIARLRKMLDEARASADRPGSAPTAAGASSDVGPVASSDGPAAAGTPRPPALPPPARVLWRIEEAEGRGQGQVWCLVEYDDGTERFWTCASCGHDNDLEIDACEACGASRPDPDPDQAPPPRAGHASGKPHASAADVPKSGWELEPALLDRAAEMGIDPGALFLPAPALSAEETDQLHDDLQAAEDGMAEARADFRRYRVRAELTIRQKDQALRAARAELEQRFGENVRAIAGTDVAGDLRRAQAEAECLRQESDAAKRKLEESADRAGELVRKNAELSSALEAAQSASADWRQKFEQKAHEERERAARGAVADARAGGQAARLQAEFDSYKQRASALLHDREAALQAALRQLQDAAGGGGKSGGPAGGGGEAARGTTKDRYLRNVVLRYMSSSDHSEKKRIEIAVSQILGFTDAERAGVEARRARDASWTGGWVPGV